MDGSPIPDQSSSSLSLSLGQSGIPGKPSASEGSLDPFRFPRDDGGRSPTQMARRDLDAVLQLLAGRAQYITGASGVAIALREGTEMICRARAGSSAPETGVRLQVNSGLSGESVRSRQILRCDDAETDPRVNRESCRGLGIASVMVMPLLDEGAVVGLFELLSSKAYAFEERDVIALQRLGEMVLTAVKHAATTNEAVKEAVAFHFDSRVEAGVMTASAALIEELPAEQPEAPAVPAERGNIGQCEACGFPVSEGRTVCLDCEADRASGSKLEVSPAIDETPAFLSQLAAEAQRKSWVRSHLYLTAALLMGAATVATLLWLR